MRNLWNMTGILEEERTIEEEFLLTSDDVGAVPKTLTRDGVTYRLNEGGVELLVTRKELWRDQEVLEEYVSYAVEDNDIERLQKEIVKDGRVLDLIGVEYHVTDTTQSGLPLAYEAVCRYAVNVDRDREVPVQWKATATYTGTVEEEEAGETAPEAETPQEEETQERGEAVPEGNHEIPAVGRPEEVRGMERTDAVRDSAGPEATEAEGIPLETEAMGETETFAEEAVPMAASMEESAVPLNDAVAGFLGTVLLGTAFVCGIVARRRNLVAVYANGGEKKGRFLGKTFARREKGFWVIPISERLLRLSDSGTGELVLRPSGKVLRGRIRKAKIVSPTGTFYKDVEDTMALWEDNLSGAGWPSKTMETEC